MKDYLLIDLKDPHPGEVGEEEQEGGEGGGVPDDLSRLRLIDWTRVQAAVEKTNQANHDLGKNCYKNFSSFIFVNGTCVLIWYSTAFSSTVDVLAPAPVNFDSFSAGGLILTFAKCTVVPVLYISSLMLLTVGDYSYVHSCRFGARPNRINELSGSGLLPGLSYF